MSELEVSTHVKPDQITFLNRLNDHRNIFAFTLVLGGTFAILTIPNYFAEDSDEALLGTWFASLVTASVALPIAILYRIVHKTEEKKRANEIIEKMNLPSRPYRTPIRSVENGISRLYRMSARLESSPQGTRLKKLLVYGYTLIATYAGLIAYFSDSWYDVGTVLALLVSIYVCAFFLAWVIQFFIASWKTLVPNNKKQQEQPTPHQSV